VTPIAVTTGVGPKGHETLLMQPPSDDEGSTNSRLNTPDSGFGTLTPSQEESIMVDIMTTTNGLGFGVIGRFLLNDGMTSFSLHSLPESLSQGTIATQYPGDASVASAL